MEDWKARYKCQTLSSSCVLIPPPFALLFYSFYLVSLALLHTWVYKFGDQNGVHLLKEPGDFAQVIWWLDKRGVLGWRCVVWRCRRGLLMRLSRFRTWVVCTSWWIPEWERKEGRVGDFNTHFPQLREWKWRHQTYALDVIEKAISTIFTIAVPRPNLQTLILDNWFMFLISSNSATSI